MVDAEAHNPTELFQTASSTTESTLPKLSISILLLWLTLSAIGIVVAKWMMGPDFVEQFHAAGISRSIAKTLQFLSAVSASIAAAQLIGLGALVIASRRGSQVFLKHPGHWLVVIACALYLVGFTSQFVAQFNQYLVSNYDWTEIGWRIREFFNSTWSVIAAYLVPAVLNFAAAYYHRGTWRWIFGLLATQPIMLMIFSGVRQSFSTLAGGFGIEGVVNSTLLAGVVLIVVGTMAIEAWKRFERDWVHWLGAFALIFFLSITGGVGAFY